MQRIEFSTTGGSDVLSHVEVDDPTPTGDQVLIDVAASGINFIDTYHRSGLYEVPLPSGLGLEGAGTVVALGPDSTEFAVGDRVAWTGAMGSYATRHVVPQDALVRVPDGVGLDTAAAVMLQGLTAHYLATSTWPLEAGQRCLVHAGAGGVGLLLIQIAKLRGAEVFTTVGTEEKAKLARGAGADHVVMYCEVDFVEEIRRIAGVEQPLDVAYDGVGATTFEGSLALTRPRGVVASFGNASGPPAPISPLALSPSRFLTRPTLFDYIATPEELRRRTDELFAWMAAGDLDVRIGATFPLAEAAAAHDALEGRRTTGKVLLTP